MTTFSTEMSTDQSIDQQLPSTTAGQCINEQREQSISTDSSTNQSICYQYTKVGSVVIVNNHRYHFSYNIQILPHAVCESEYNDFWTMRGKLGSLVLKIQKIVERADIDIDELKQLLILSYQQFESMIQEATTFSRVFVIVRKFCSPVNIEVLILIGDHFNLSDVINVIQQYEVEEQNYRKKLLSTAFAKDLMIEAALIDRHPIPDSTISLKLKSPRAEHSTVKEFEIVINNVFSDGSQCIHVCKVGEGCIFVTMCVPKPLMGTLVKIAKTKLPYLIGIGVIMLKIGDEIILDKSDNEVHNELLILT